jgi:hypothetical protein
MLALWRAVCSKCAIKISRKQRIFSVPTLEVGENLPAPAKDFVKRWDQWLSEKPVPA